jgi:uncharacterized protein YdeI (YjbR/CyaY-like superfamily)
LDITETYYPENAKQWRKWLEKNADKKKEIWLIYYKKESGKSRVPYNDAVDEALCFGWIDSTLKPVDKDSFAQRFTPRRKGSPISAMNKERFRRLVEEGRMTEKGFEYLRPEDARELQVEAKLVIPKDILAAIKNNRAAWDNFQKFPESYKRIRIGWIDGVRYRPEVF